jgi:hypothetical protein
MLVGRAYSKGGNFMAEGVRSEPQQKKVLKRLVASG